MPQQTQSCLQRAASEAEKNKRQTQISCLQRAASGWPQTETSRGASKISDDEDWEDQGSEENYRSTKTICSTKDKIIPSSSKSSMIASWCIGCT
jgi:hypothetical protein